MTDAELNTELSNMRRELAEIRGGAYGSIPTLGEVREFLKAGRPQDDAYARLLLMWMLIELEAAHEKAHG